METLISIAAVVFTIWLIAKFVQSVRTRRAARAVVTQARQETAGASNSQTPAVSSESALGPVNYYANDNHHQADNWFQFCYKKVGNEWLIYILRMPSLNGRSASLHNTHRHTSDSKYWICRDPQPRTLHDAQNVSRVWADCIMEYIATGTTF